MIHKLAAIAAASVFAFTPLVAAAQTSEQVPQITTTLQSGMSGEEVATLQEFLGKLTAIYPEGLVTGYFGSLTKRAVMKFQAYMGLDQVGIVGPKTKRSLNSLMVAAASAAGQANRSPNANPATPATPATPSPGTGTAATPATPATPSANSQGGRGQTVVDEAPPIITELSLSIVSGTAVRISWFTNEPATSAVLIASSTAFLPTYLASSSPTLTTNHSLVIAGLSYSTRYNYVVSSQDAAGNTGTSGVEQFLTPAQPTSPPPTATTTPPVLPPPVSTTTPGVPINRDVPTLSPTGEITSLNNPAGMKVSPSGELWIADYHNDNIKVYSSNLTYLRTIGSTRSASPGFFSEPWDIAFDSVGQAYITDTNNVRVQVFSPTGTYLRQFPSSAYQGIVIDPSVGYAYVSGRTIEKFNLTGDKIATLPLGENVYPRNIAQDTSGRLYFSNYTGNSIVITDNTGATIKKIDLGYQPMFVDVDDKYRIWVADHTHGKIQVYDSAGVLITSFDLPLTSTWGNPNALEVEGNKLYVSLYFENKVKVYSISN